MEHCLSIDVEGFVEGMAESFTIPGQYFDSEAEAREIEINIMTTLEFMDRQKITGTFFLLGRIAHQQPAVVRRIADAGHEIASHSFCHKRIFGQSPSEFRTDVDRARKQLEDVSGKPVLGFRAPDFSIRSDTLWALDILAETGHRYDSSLTPTDVHDVYGVRGVPASINRLANGLLEFPPSTFKFLGRTVPFGGGGYFRLYPLRLTRRLIRRSERQGNPAMLYVHPYEIGPSAPRVPGLSWQRRFRHYYHLANGVDRLQQAVRGLRFATATTILNHHPAGQ